MGDYALLERLQAGEEIARSSSPAATTPVTRAILESGGLFAFGAKVRSGEIRVDPPATPPRPMTMAEKIIASHLVGGTAASAVKPATSAGQGRRRLQPRASRPRRYTTSCVPSTARTTASRTRSWPSRTTCCTRTASRRCALLPRSRRAACSTSSSADTGVRDVTGQGRRLRRDCYEVAREEFVDRRLHPGDPPAHLHGRGNNADLARAMEYAGHGLLRLHVPRGAESIRSSVGNSRWCHRQGRDPARCRDLGPARETSIGAMESGSGPPRSRRTKC